MSKIIGVTVGTPISPKTIEDQLKPVKTVNGVSPDKNGNVNVEVEGGVGGYYTPAIRQVDQSTAQVTFTPSDADMPSVASTHISLPKGEDGEDGRGIVSIKRKNGNGSPGTTDTYAIVYTDNTSSTFPVYNGKDGKDGAKGDPGKTPEKGKDYWTDADKAEMIMNVLLSLPVYNGEVVDE